MIHLVFHLFLGLQRVIYRSKTLRLAVVVRPCTSSMMNYRRTHRCIAKVLSAIFYLVYWLLKAHNLCGTDSEVYPYDLRMMMMAGVCLFVCNLGPVLTMRRRIHGEKCFVVVRPIHWSQFM